MQNVVVIGAGVGGLAAAAVLSRQGYAVTVLEAHIYPGGCAGTFFHKGYRFDAGATLAGGFYPGGPMDLVSRASGEVVIPARPLELSLVVHLPGGLQVRRWGDERRWEETASVFGRESLRFWKWQEKTADAMWDLALQLPPWPAQNIRQGGQLIQAGLRWVSKDLKRMKPGLFADAFRTVSAHLKGQPDLLRLFIDGQLLISAQTTSSFTNALYGASALDLPRRGVVQIEGGMGGIAQGLAEAVQRNGGKVLYRKEAVRIVVERGKPIGVETRRGEFYPAEQVIANLPPWNLAELLKENIPPALAGLPAKPKDGWGAFVAYVGFDRSILPDHFPLHHQVIVREPLGEGNTAFLSLSPTWDANRAPAGKRALTISTHTALEGWWQAHEHDPEGYEKRKNDATDKLLDAAEKAIPNLRQAAHLVMPGTPVSFQRFTKRAWGWVGGFPQTSLFRYWGPRLAPGIWMVGDSIFPGQSTAAVALGGLRVAGLVASQINDRSL